MFACIGARVCVKGGKKKGKLLCTQQPRLPNPLPRYGIN